MPDAARTLVADIVWMIAGLLIWAIHLAVVYGVTAIACARHAPIPIPSAVAAATVVAAAAAAWVGVRAFRRWREAGPASRLVPFVAAAGGAFSFVAILWGGLPAIFVPACL